MIVLKDVRKGFNQGKGNEVWAVRGISLNISEKHTTVLTGPSGSGKTTLLTMIGGLSRPTSGRILLRDRDVSGLPERFLTEVRRSTFGFVFQQYNLVKGLSALDNVMLPAYPLGLKRNELREKAANILDKMGLAKRKLSKVEWLSGGEAQRVAISRALINDPEVVIADEPTANLDTTLSAQFLETLEELKGDGRTVLMTSHDPLVYESPMVDTVVQMRDGMLVSEG